MGTTVRSVRFDTHTDTRHCYSTHELQLKEAHPASFKKERKREIKRERERVDLTAQEVLVHSLVGTLRI